MKDPERVRRAHDAARSALGAPASSGQEHRTAPPAALNAETMPAIVETAIQVAIRQRQFDDLPGAGKPIPGLGDHHDPDWWIRRKIERENLTGLGPPVVTKPRDVDAEVEAWQGRRAAAATAEPPALEPRKRWFRRS